MNLKNIVLRSTGLLVKLIMDQTFYHFRNFGLAGWCSSRTPIIPLGADF